MKVVGIVAVATVLALSSSSQAFAKHRHHHHHHGTTTGMSRTGPSGPGIEPGATDKSRPGGKGVSNRPGD
jgi:hypothetical protein